MPDPLTRLEELPVKDAIRLAKARDAAEIKALALAAFPPEEASFFEGMLDGLFLDPLREGTWLVVDALQGLAAASYHALEPHSEDVWNLHFVAVAPAQQGRGIGQALLARIEAALKEASARLLLIETSSTKAYAPTRAFYLKLGFVEEARIRDYYGSGDDKVVFWKCLSGPTLD